MMVQQRDKERLETLIKDTLTLLCKNGLTFRTEFSVEALIGVTLDKEDVMLININEHIKSDNAPLEESDSPKTGSEKRRHRKRKKERRNEASDSASSDGVVGLSDDSDSGEPQIKVSTPSVKQESEDLSEDVVFVKQEAEDWPTVSWPGAENLGNSSSIGFPQSLQNNPSFLSGTSMVSDVSQNNSMMWMQDSPGMSIGGQGPGGTTQTQRLDSSQLLDTDEISPGYKECTYCGQRMNIGSFRDHMYRHQGKFAFICEVCDKGFMRKRDFEGHMSIHTGVKDYLCTVCGKAFSLKRNLKSHHKRVHQMDHVDQ